ncbi:hypothetical protein [Agarivorans sp. Alg241-V36]|uniref:hypothetical protein n=1 Tax=Agarivorans sp. Alg241-V36 TaxID=2305992 RepID=UPI0013D0CB05|nr:hypothetical protein [Agarivorans sp. Alg241-V36]
MSDPDNSIEDLLNKVIKKLLPLVNASIPRLMEELDMDPMVDVASDKETLPEFPFPVPSWPPYVWVKPELSYAIFDMVGLASLRIDTMTIEKVNCRADFEESDTQHLSEYAGELEFVGNLERDISTKVLGRVRAQAKMPWPFPDVNASVAVKGKATAQGGGANGKAIFTASIKDGQVCFNKLDIYLIHLTYSNITIKIDGLGIFNELLKPVVSIIEYFFGEQLRTLVASLVQSALNQELRDLLPVCTNE